MPVVDSIVTCPVHRSFRVEQVGGLFDVDLAQKASVSFSVEIPDESEDWSIGAIVGPSGSGKTTISRQAFGDCLFRGAKWPKDKAVVDGFGDRPIKDVTATLTAVGFSSPPSWIKPYHVLSNGERFRCDLARAMMADSPLVAFDEFTSVVDRTVAQIGSAAVAKAIRKGNLAKRFVAVTCHYDILEWLEPDWVVDMATGVLARGRLRRPEIRLEIHRSHHSAWRLFARHHYLSGNLNRASRCYVGFVADHPVVFCAILPVVGQKRAVRWRISRVVCLPDYQGVGIGTGMVEALAERYAGAGYVMDITMSHPAMIAYCGKSPRWKCLKQDRARGGHSTWKGYKGDSFKRSVVSFRYVGGGRVAVRSPETCEVAPE